MTADAKQESFSQVNRITISNHCEGTSSMESRRCTVSGYISLTRMVVQIFAEGGRISGCDKASPAFLRHRIVGFDTIPRLGEPAARYDCDFGRTS